MYIDLLNFVEKCFIKNGQLGTFSPRRGSNTIVDSTYHKTVKMKVEFQYLIYTNNFYHYQFQFYFELKLYFVYAIVTDNTT